MEASTSEQIKSVVVIAVIAGEAVEILLWHLFAEPTLYDIGLVACDVLTLPSV